MPTYERGDYVKVEFQDETTVIGEWMWVRVHDCDDANQLVFGNQRTERSHVAKEDRTGQTSSLQAQRDGSYRTKRLP
jgi:hypothetical protein